MTSTRVISTFPKPHNSNATPYLNNNNFHVPSKEVATGQKKIAKVIVLGDMGVGKTCVLKRFCDVYFDYTLKTSLSFDIKKEMFEILQVPFELQLWDTLGQERFQALNRSYFRDAHALLLMIDLSRIKTLEEINKWLIHPLEMNNERPLLFLVGTKFDLISESMYEEIKKKVIRKANELKAEYWPVSAFNGMNVNELFYRVAALAFNTIMKKAEPFKETITLKKPDEKKPETNGGCC